MEPFTTAVWNIISTKAWERVGQGIGDNLVERGKKLVELLGQKSPNTLKTIQQAEGSSETLTQAIEQLEATANSDPEVKEAVEALASAVKAQPQSMENIANTVAKKGIVAQQSVVTGNTFNF